MNGEQIVNYQKLLEIGKEIVSNSEREDIREKYRESKSDTTLTVTRHRLITSRAARLAQMVINNGGTKSEVKKAITNMLVCTDAMKYKLDWKKWQADNDIALLTRKYMVVIKMV